MLIKDFHEINENVEINTAWDIDGYYIPNTKGNLKDSIRHMIAKKRSQANYCKSKALYDLQKRELELIEIYKKMLSELKI